jgi:hypothetical protein
LMSLLKNRRSIWLLGKRELSDLTIKLIMWF